MSKQILWARWSMLTMYVNVLSSLFIQLRLYGLAAQSFSIQRPSLVLCTSPRPKHRQSTAQATDGDGMSSQSAKSLWSDHRVPGPGSHQIISVWQSPIKPFENSSRYAPYLPLLHGSAVNVRTVVPHFSLGPEAKSPPHERK